MTRVTRHRGAPRLRARLAVLTLAAAALLPFTASGPARADDREDMYQRLGVDAAGADYLMLIDKSGSMRESFPSLKDNLKKFAAALGPGDRIALVPFGAEPISAPWLTPRSPEAAAAVDGLAPPSPSPTDFYRALDWAADHLAKDDSGGGRVATVVLLTDGDPAGGGLPECKLPGDAAWQALRAKVAKLAERRPVNAYALPIAAPAKHCPDVTAMSVLRLAFPSAEELDPGNAQAGLYLDQAKAGTRAAGARQALRTGGELTKPVVVTWPGGLDRIDPAKPDVRITVRLDTTGKSPLKVARLSGRFTGTFTDSKGDHAQDVPFAVEPADATVDPGRPVTLTLTLRLPAAAHPVTEHGIGLVGSVELRGTVTSPYAELAGGGLSTQVTSTLEPARASLAGTGSSGVPAWMFLVLLLVVLAVFLYLATGYLARRPRMSGGLLAVLPDGAEVAVIVHNKRAVGPLALGEPGGTVDVRGVRVQGRRAMSVTYTPLGGTADTKPLSTGGSVMIRGVDFHHREHERPAQPSGSRPERTSA